MNAHQQTIANQVASGQSILSTHFDLSQFAEQVDGAAESQSADIPPWLFDDPAFASPSAMPAPSSAPAANTAVDTDKLPTFTKFKAIRIARAHSGTSEVRLVEELVAEGGKPHFYFEEVQTYPYQTTRMVIVSATKAIKINALNSDDEAIATSKQAEKYFAAAVARKYPSETTRGGITMATHINVL